MILSGDGILNVIFVDLRVLKLYRGQIIWVTFIYGATLYPLMI